MWMICFPQAMETCMGSDPEPYMVTIFLYIYGSKWILDLKKIEI